MVLIKSSSIAFLSRRGLGIPDETALVLLAMASFLLLSDTLCWRRTNGTDALQREFQGAFLH